MLPEVIARFRREAQPAAVLDDHPQHSTRGQYRQATADTRRVGKQADLGMRVDGDFPTYYTGEAKGSKTSRRNTHG